MKVGDLVRHNYRDEKPIGIIVAVWGGGYSKTTVKVKWLNDPKYDNDLAIEPFYLEKLT